MTMGVERRQEIIETLAQRLERAGMTAPAIALLEANKPLSFLGSQALVVLQPLLRPVFAGTDDWIAFLEDRENVELLIRRLESGPGHAQPAG